MRKESGLCRWVFRDSKQTLTVSKCLLRHNMPFDCNMSYYFCELLKQKTYILEGNNIWREDFSFTFCKLQNNCWVPCISRGMETYKKLLHLYMFHYQITTNIFEESKVAIPLSFDLHFDPCLAWIQLPWQRSHEADQALQKPLHHLHNNRWMWKHAAFFLVNKKHLLLLSETVATWE